MALRRFVAWLLATLAVAGSASAQLLLMHGTGDDNVHMQGTERLVNRLVELGKDFDMILYPNRTHAIAEGPGTGARRRLVERFRFSVIRDVAADLRCGRPAASESQRLADDVTAEGSSNTSTTTKTYLNLSPEDAMREFQSSNYARRGV